MSQRLSRIALPVLRVSARAIASRSRSISPATRSSSAARSPVGVRDQSVVSKARRAAAMAAWTCSSVATSTSVTTVPSDGLTTWLQVPSPDAIHWPSMKRLGTMTSGARLAASFDRPSNAVKATMRRADRRVSRPTAGYPHCSR